MRSAAAGVMQVDFDATGLSRGDSRWWLQIGIERVRDATGQETVSKLALPCHEVSTVTR
ncbi:MAG: hypothetical protein ACRD6N_18280 [Pyrinomonadaceae bacterium]